MAWLGNKLKPAAAGTTDATSASGAAAPAGSITASNAMSAMYPNGRPVMAIRLPSGACADSETAFPSFTAKTVPKLSRLWLSLLSPSLPLAALGSLLVSAELLLGSGEPSS